MHDASSPWMDALDRDRAPSTIRPNLDELWAEYRRKRAAGKSPFSAAVRVAFEVDRLGYAFAVGYPAALEQLIAGIEVPCALCVTESGGNGPRAIMTRLEQSQHGYRLRGSKTFVTFGTRAGTLVVACRVGDKADGRPDIAVVRIPASRPGVTVQELPAMPFVPELVHARIELQDVAVEPDERLAGDGYLDYVKPFRTIEDIHVVGAALAYVAGMALRAGDIPDLAAELSAHIMALDGIRDASPLDPRVHVVLHGVLRRVGHTLDSDTFARLLESVGADERARWARDRALLDVASKAREARFERAQRDLGWARKPGGA